MPNPWDDMLHQYNWLLDHQMLYGGTAEQARADWEQMKVYERSKGLPFSLPNQEGAYVITDVK